MRLYYVDAVEEVVEKGKPKLVEDEFAMLAVDPEDLAARCNHRFLKWAQVKDLAGYPLSRFWPDVRFAKQEETTCTTC